MTHPKINKVIFALEKGFAKVRPNNNLSVTKNKDGTEAWVKLINDVDLSEFAGILLNKAVFFEEHRNKVQKDIYSLEWRTEEESLK